MTLREWDAKLRLVPYRTVPLVNNEIYHVFNRGVEKRSIFLSPGDYERFLMVLNYYQHGGPKPRFSQLSRFQDLKIDANKKIVEIVCYCLMPNHFHLLIRQLKKTGVSEFMRKVSDSFTRYFNTKHDRIGSLFQGAFKAIRIESDEQLIHVSRYIHLNPLVSILVKDLKDYLWSSYLDYIGKNFGGPCNNRAVMDFFNSKEEYGQFVLDQEDYGKRLEFIKHHLVDK